MKEKSILHYTLHKPRSYKKHVALMISHTSQNETWGESIKQNCWIWWPLTINTNKYDI